MKISLPQIYIILLFYIAPFIDAASGYLILSEIIPEGGAGSPSQFFRLILLLIALRLTMLYEKFFYIVTFLIIYIIAVEFIFFMVHNSFYGYIIGLVYGSKLIYLMLTFMTLFILLKNHTISFLRLLKHIRNYIAITAILLILPFIFGLGFNTYGEGTFGFKGYYAAGNGLGIFMGIGLLLSIYYWKITNERYSLILSFIIMFSTIIIGSKTALILSIFGFSSIIFLQHNIYIKSMVIVIIFLVVGIFLDHLLGAFNQVFDVIIFRFGNSESFLSFIFSNRDNYFIDAINTVSLDGLFLLRLFFGFGVYISFRDPMTSYNVIDILESDFADIFFMYGMVFILFYMMFIFFHLYQVFNKKKFFLGFVFLLLMTHSILAGHVLFNGMSGVLVPLLSLLILNSQQGSK